MSSDGDEKCCSIFLDWPNWGSLVEKKKFSSTCGLRSTKAATSPNNTTVAASIHQCAPGRIMEANIIQFDAAAREIQETKDREPRSRPYAKATPKVFASGRRSRRRSLVNAE